MTELIAPTAALRESWLDALQDWGTTDQDGASVFLAERHGWDLRRAEDFARWVKLLQDLALPGFSPPEGFVGQTTLWVVEEEEYLGAVSLRHDLGTDYLAEVGGHIGYGIRPAARRRGLAKFALAGALEEARRLGMDRVLVTCHDSNIGSVRTIESGGGTLERIVPVEQIQQRFGINEPMRRYWIHL